MNIGDKVYAAQEDCENWTNDDEAEAVNEAVENNPDVVTGSEITIYVGEVCSTKASDFVPDRIAEILNERAYEDMGDLAENWLHEQEDKLQESFTDFIDKFCTENKCHPTFYKVENIRPVRAKVIVDSHGMLDDYSIIDA